MKKRSKIVGCILSVCMILSAAAPVQAVSSAQGIGDKGQSKSFDSSNGTGIDLTQGTLEMFDAETFNEYEYVSALQVKTAAELGEIGLTSLEAKEIIDEFHVALSKRASLPDEELIGLGYSSEEINILRDYANGDALTDAEFRAVTGTCTGKFTRHSVTSTTAEFSYTWTWDHCPIITLSDASAMTWIAYDADAGDFGVEVTSKVLLIDYYFKGNAASDGSTKAYTAPGVEEDTLEFNTVYMQVPVYRTYGAGNGIIFDCYAKTGTIKVAIKVPDGDSHTINHIFVGGLYGHTTVGVGYPEISVGKDVSISFSGNMSIDPVAGRKATLYRTKETISYWAD